MNGKIEQQGELLTAPSSATYILYFPVNFSVKDYYINFKTLGSDRSERDFRINNYATDVTTGYIKINMNPGATEFSWFCTGY